MITTYLVCVVCGGRLETTRQDKGAVTVVSSDNTAEFLARHVAGCRGGKPTDATDKGFRTESVVSDAPA